MGGAPLYPGSRYNSYTGWADDGPLRWSSVPIRGSGDSASASTYDSPSRECGPAASGEHTVSKRL